MSFWSYPCLQTHGNGRWLVEPAESNAVSLDGLGIDTRSLRPGQAYVAIRGQRFDGHDFLAQAARARAALLIVSDPEKAERFVTQSSQNPGPRPVPPVLLVDDTLGALHRLAEGYRDRLAQCGTVVIAVTGSNGKTTTRNLIYHLLSSGGDQGDGSTAGGKAPQRKRAASGHRWGRGRGTQSPKSFNNQIGVPLTLLGAKEGDDFVVVEVGTNHPGEIACLAAIVRPDVAVITGIGSAHIQGLGDLRGVAVEKSSLARFVKRGGLVVFNGDQPVLEQHIEVPAGVTTARFGHDKAHEACLRQYRGHEHGVTFEATFRAQDRQEAGSPPDTGQALLPARSWAESFELPLLGEHNAMNALAAILVARALGVDGQQITAALASAQPVEMRLDVRHVGGSARPITVINDAYNANPDSMVAALRVLAGYLRSSPQGRRVAVLGDMLELGDATRELHQELGRRIAEIDTEARHRSEGPNGRPQAEAAPGLCGDGPADGGGIDVAVLIGPLAAYTAWQLGQLWGSSTSRRVFTYGNWNEVVGSKVAAMLRAGDVVLIKASRAMGLEELIPKLGQPEDDESPGPQPPPSSPYSRALCTRHDPSRDRQGPRRGR